MKTTDVRISDCPGMTIDLVASAQLRREWTGITLSGHFWRLYRNDAGGAGVYLNGERLELKPEKLYLIPPNCGLKTWLTGDPNQIFIHFEISNLLGSPDHLCNELTPPDGLRQTFDRIEELLKGREDFTASPELFLSALSAVSGALALLPKDACCAPIFDERIARVCKNLHALLGADHTLESMAHLAGMAPNAFLRRFREVTGATPYQYLLSIRYATAARCLRNGMHDIATICEMIGVRDRFHFSRTFKSLYGCPPSQYRAAPKKNEFSHRLNGG